MLSRLDWMMLQPKVMVDLGCGTGELSALLQKRYPDAILLAVDSSFSMLSYAKNKNKIQGAFVGDGFQLPLANDSVDLIFANFLLPWQKNYSPILQEWHRVLRPEGLLLCSLLGPDTLQECRHLLKDEHLPSLVDLHNIGDLLLHQFADPVLDVTHYTLCYRETNRLLKELEASGMWFPDEKTKQQQLNLPISAKRWEITFEVIYAHAFKKADLTAPKNKTEFKIPLSSLKQEAKKKRI